MTIRRVVPPVYAITCDAGDCDEDINGCSEYTLRREAEEEGWQLRPLGGKGSRSAPALCPQHRTVQTGDAR